MKKSHTLWLLGGGALVLYFLSQQSASAQGQQGQGQLPSGGGQGYGGSYSQMGATRPRFRR